MPLRDGGHAGSGVRKLWFAVHGGYAKPQKRRIVFQHNT